MDNVNNTMEQGAGSQSYAAITVTLQAPQELDGEMVTELRMRPPKARDVINAADMTPTENSEDAHLFASLCNVPIHFILGLAYYDYKQLEAAYDRFLYPTRIHCEMRSLPLSEALEAVSPNYVGSNPEPSPAGSIQSTES